MPDRELAAQPEVGMCIHYSRENVNDWVLMVEKVTPQKVYWLWKDGIATLEQANNVDEWAQEVYYRKEWVDFMINPQNRWGRTTINVLTHFNRNPEWEV